MTDLTAKGIFHDYTGSMQVSKWTFTKVYGRAIQNGMQEMSFAAFVMYRALESPIWTQNPTERLGKAYN